MNKDIKFGFSVIGRYTVIKVNCKLSDNQVDKLREIYKDWLTLTDHARGIRVEGVLPEGCVQDFYVELRKAILISKVSKLNAEIDALHTQGAKHTRTITVASIDLEKIN